MSVDVPPVNSLSPSLQKLIDGMSNVRKLHQLVCAHPQTSDTNAAESYI